MHRLTICIGVAAGFLASTANAQELNLYSSRHYDTDDRMYERFTELTGIKINRVEGKADELIVRIEAEGENGPADVLLTVDAGRLWRAEKAGIFEPVTSEVLDARIPAEFRHPDGLWYGFSERARVIYYDRETVDPALIQTYEDLARPELDGKVCIRSSSNIYQLSLMAALIEHAGPEAAKAWAEGVSGNFARNPQGGDTDQIKAIAAGACAVSLGNTYYFARLMNSDNPEDQAVVERIGWVFPNQGDRGTHVNISGAGMVKGAPHPEAALAFLEFLASDEAQVYFANGSNEYPVVDGIEIDNPALDKMGDFEADTLNVSVLGKNQTQAQILYDEAGWE